MDIPSHDRRVVRSQPEALLPPQFRQPDVPGILSARARPVNAIAAFSRRPYLRYGAVGRSPGLGYSHKISVKMSKDGSGPLTVYQYLPDTVDPRGQKGK